MFFEFSISSFFLDKIRKIRGHRPFQIKERVFQIKEQLSLIEERLFKKGEFFKTSARKKKG